MRHNVVRVLLAASLLFPIVACHREGSANFTVVHRFPHDTTAFTEGLLYSDGALFESTGQYGESQLRRVELATGRVLAAVPLARNRFGEGLALLHGRLYQLTWKSGTGYVYDAGTLARVDSFHFAGEGWGLTTDGTDLIMSDGSDTLRYLDPTSFAVTRTVAVTDKGLPISPLNELEYVRGDIFANVYQTHLVERIDSRTGSAVQWFDLTALVPPTDLASDMNVLNGIAWDSLTGDLFVTGKNWPTLFEIRIRARPAP